MMNHSNQPQIFEKAHPLVTLCNMSSTNTRGKKKLPSMDTTTSTISYPTYYYTKVNRPFYRKAQCAARETQMPESTFNGMLTW
jgi:hypothetical protein